MAEGDIVKSALRALLLQPRVWAMRVNSGVFVVGGRHIHGAPKGTPDIIGAHDGRMFGIEIKTSEKWSKRSEAQAAWAKMAKEMNIKCGVARSATETLALIEEWFK